MCYVSSIFYLYLAAHRDSRWEEYWEHNEAISIVMEIIFCIYMIIQFFKAYIPQYQTKEIRDFSQIAQRYFNGDFKLDLFALIPWAHFTEHPNNYQRLLYLLKLVRLKKGITIFDYHTLMKLIKKIFTKHISDKCKTDEKYASDMHGQNYMGVVLNISYALKIFEWSFIILNLSYIVGIFWLIFTTISIEIYHDGLDDEGKKEIVDDQFITAYSMDTMTLGKQMLIVTYYMFTTMSTVGFGDFHPKSDIERLVCILILVGGVAIFSMIMGNFINIIEEFRTFNDELDEGEKLLKFFGVLRKFNYNQQLP